MPAKQDEKDKQKILKAIESGDHAIPVIAKKIGRSAQTVRRLVKIMAAERMILLTDKTPPYYYCELPNKEFNYHDPFALCTGSRRVLAEDQDPASDVLPAEIAREDRGSSEDSRRNGNDCFSALSYYQARLIGGYGQPRELRDIL